MLGCFNLAFFNKYINEFYILFMGLIDISVHITGLKGILKSIWNGFQKLPNYLKSSLIITLIVGVFYFTFANKKINVTEKTLSEFKTEVVTLKQKISITVQKDYYEYDKKQLLFILNSIEARDNHLKLVIIQLANIIENYSKANTPNNNIIINDLEQLKNSASIFYNTQQEEIQVFLKKYKQKLEIDSLEINK